MSNAVRGYVYVSIQFVLLAALVFVPWPMTWPLPAWALTLCWVVVGIGVAVVALSLIGLGASLTAHPVPKSGAELKTGGIYAAVRHPIYSGILLAAFAAAALKQSWWALACVVLLVVLFSVKARFEERLLLQTYPGYGAYAARVGRFVPGVGRMRHRTDRN